MQNRRNDIKELSVKQLFSGSEKYIIPIYQRNYAWKEPQINQLIEDVADYAKVYPENNYYIGTLVVFEKRWNGHVRYDTIDGQQRLTTLFVLLSVLNNNFKQEHESINEWFEMNLDFETREVSTATLFKIFKNEIYSGDDLNPNILQAYEDISKSLRKLEKEKQVSVYNFCKYLLEKVVILRVPVPEDTDLNHYFEIMNNRGEQLEKHEILKTGLLNVIKNDKRSTQTFNLIWNACSNMEKYVQYGFSQSQRNKFFQREPEDEKEGWDNFRFQSFDEITELLKSDDPHLNNGEKDLNLFEMDESTQNIENRITELVKKPIVDASAGDEIDDSGERFTSPINFSNFLLQVLRIQTGEDVPLDDKRLLLTFEIYYKEKKEEDATHFVKDFGYSLLKIRFLFDKYVLKREFLKGKDGWSLKKLHRRKNNNSKSYSGYYVNSFGDENENEGENKNLIMLLSMFHVSAPTLIYKHWLNAALKYVFEQDMVTPTEYIEYLEDLAESYLLNRYLAESPLDYYEIIYDNYGKRVSSNIDISLLDKGTEVENFIFNYLDYLLWKDDNEKEKREYIDFEFSFRSSVEHYYPQHPIENIEKLDESILNDFGNLCLISRSKNSRLSNFPPEAKKSYYIDNNVKDSIKQAIMMRYDNWTIKEIQEHGRMMKEVLLTQASSNLFRQLNMY